LTDRRSLRRGSLGAPDVEAKARDVARDERGQRRELEVIAAARQ
jgi:hypothetical protein